MAALTEAQAQALVQDLRRLTSEIETMGEEGREGLVGMRPSLEALLKSCTVKDDKIPDGTWDQLPDRERLGLRLQSMQKALNTLLRDKDEPNDPKNFMYRSHASNTWIAVLVVGALVIIALVLWGVFRYWDGATAKDASERNILRMVILMGALGGTIHWMSSLANFIGNGNLFGRWSPYYLLSPFQGAALALLVYLLLRVGVLAPPTNGASPAQSLNLLGLYAFSGLAGLFAKQAIEMLRDVFSVIFKKVEAKDAGRQSKGPSEGDEPKATQPKPVPAGTKP
jgi:hypothetical protein